MKPLFAFAAAFVFIACEGTTPLKPDPLPVLDGGDSSSSSSSSSSGSSGGDSSGTRLRRYVYTSDDGLIGGVSGMFYDSLMNIDCGALLTPMGYRCLPPLLSMPKKIGNVFGDTACATAAQVAPSDCPVPTFARESTDVTCSEPSVTRIWHVSPAGNTIYTKVGTDCIPEVLQPAFTVIAIGPEVDYANFASMSLEHE